MTKYDKTITVKVSIDQFDKIHNIASERGTDVSVILRENIDSLGETKEEVINQLEFHKYQKDLFEKKLKMKKK